MPETETKPTLDPDVEQTVEKLYQAIHSMSIVDASLVLLALDGLSYKQTAEVLGITESNVGARLNRAKTKLAELLKGQNDEI